MQVIADAIDGAEIARRTIAVYIALSMMMIFLIAKPIHTAVGIKWTITVRIAFSIKRVFITIPINFTIRITWTVPVEFAGNIWPRSWRWGMEIY